MDTQFFPDFNLNFNLRHPKAKKATIIYAVISANKRQYKINTGIKVYPKFWIKRYQISIQSPLISQLDNSNNRLVNERLNDIRIAFKNCKLYICQNPKLLEKGLLKNIIESYISSNMKKEKAIKTIDTGTYILRQGFNEYYNKAVKESTIKVNEIRLNRFIEFIKNENIDDTIENILKQEILDKYKAKLISEAEKTGIGEAKYINQLCKLIVRITNDIFIKKVSYKKYNVQRLEYDKITNKLNRDDSKKIPLNNEELDSLENVELNGEENEYRDFFLFQCACGQRISDLPKLFKREMMIKENGFIITTTKENIPATVIKFDKVSEVLEKYREGFKYIKTAEWDNNVLAARCNKLLKIIAKKANLNREIEWREQKGNKIVPKKYPLYRIISTHYARHTFITNMLLQNMPIDKLCYLTGHANDKMIREVYAHLSKEDKYDLAIKEYQKISNKPQKSISNDVNEVIKIVRENEFLKQKSNKLLEENKRLKDIESELERLKYDEFLESGSPDIPTENDFIAPTTEGGYITIEEAEKQIRNRKEEN